MTDRAICAAAFFPDLLSIVDGRTSLRGGFFAPSRTFGRVAGPANRGHSQSRQATDNPARRQRRCGLTRSHEGGGG